MIKLTNLLKEIKVAPSGLFSKILDKYIQNTLEQEEFYTDDPEILEYFNSLKTSPRTVHSVEDVARKIKKIDDTITEYNGDYLGGYYGEAVIDPLIDMGKNTPYLRFSIRKVIEALHEMYNVDDEDRDEYETLMLDQWDENRIYQDILELYIRHIYTQNFKLIPDGERFYYINSLNNYPPKVNSLEELASAIITIDDTILKSKSDDDVHISVDATLNKIATSNPKYRDVIYALLDDYL